MTTTYVITLISTGSSKSSITTSNTLINSFLKIMILTFIHSDTIEMILSSESPDDDDLEDER